MALSTKCAEKSKNSGVEIEVRAEVVPVYSKWVIWSLI